MATTATTETNQTTATPPSTSTLPDGDALGNDIIASAGARDVAKLVRQTAAGGQASKARQTNEPPRVMFQPRGWTLGGRVD
jgi:hypothetical protein